MARIERLQSDGRWVCYMCSRDGMPVALIVTDGGRDAGVGYYCGPCLILGIQDGEFSLIHKSEVKPDLAVLEAKLTALEATLTIEPDADGNITVDDVTVVFR